MLFSFYVIVINFVDDTLLPSDSLRPYLQQKRKFCEEIEINSFSDASI
jgi:hypothetical protein